MILRYEIKKIYNNERADKYYTTIKTTLNVIEPCL